MDNINDENLILNELEGLSLQEFDELIDTITNEEINNLLEKRDLLWIN